MALDFAGLKQAVRDLSPTQINATTAGKAVNAAYQSLLRSRPNGGVWFGLKTSTLMTMLPDRTGGTVSLVQGDALVVGVGTAFNPTVDPSRYLKIGALVPLRIDSVQSATQLTLAQPWGEASLPSSTYNIMSPRYVLPTDADRVIRLVGPQWPLRRMTFDNIDIVDPGRNVRGEPLIYQERQLISANSVALAQASTLSGTVSVQEGASTVTVIFPASPGTSGYQVSGAPSWNTAWDVRSGGKTSVSFILDFGIPAPAAASFDWIVVVPSAAAGVGVVATVTEIEVWPIPSAYSTLSLEYRTRVPDLVADSDVPVLAPEVVRWAACADVCGKMYTRSGNEQWNTQAAQYGQLSREMLGPVVKEDRKMRGALRGVLDSDDASPLGDADWMGGWRMYGALFGGTK